MSSKSIIAAIALTTALSAPAEDLKTEITVDRTIVPVEREASRIGSLTPRLLSSPVTMKQLTLADYTDPAAITRSIPTLDPASYADTLALSPYRGYASLGYFPAFNLGASAVTNLSTTDAHASAHGCSMTVTAINRTLTAKPTATTATTPLPWQRLSINAWGGNHR